MTAPGERIRSIASRLLPRETMERVVDPIVADLQCEYGQAAARGDLWRARLSLVRNHCGLARALISLGVRYICDPRASNPGSDVVRTWIVSAIAFTVFTGALQVPALMAWPWWRNDVLFGAALAVTLIPQALPLSIPAALCVGVLWASRGKAVTRRRLRTVLTFAAALTALVWVTLEWAMPEANQLFREMVAARFSSDGVTPTLERGLSELGLSRLGQRGDPAAVRHYHTLWALCFAAIPLGLLALALSRYVRGPASAVALALSLSLAYAVSIWLNAAVSRQTWLTPLVDAWIPNFFCLTLAALLMRRARHTRHPQTF